MYGRLLPLLQAARELGLFTIHAPSEGTLWPRVAPRPDEPVVHGEDGRPGSPSRCDSVIRNATHIRNATGAIIHVLVAGYDTNICVIDKPCGVVALSRSCTALPKSSSSETPRGQAPTASTTPP